MPPPATATRLHRQSQLPRPLSSGWEAIAEPGQQATSAMLLAMLAGSAGNPTASSAVASTVPGGGPLSVVVNWRMLGSWGFSRSSFASYTTLTTLTTALAKVLLPVLAGLLALAADVSLPPALAELAVGVLVLGGVLLLAVAAGWAVDRLVSPPYVGSALLGRVRPFLAELGAGCAGAVDATDAEDAGGAGGAGVLRVAMPDLVITPARRQAPPGPSDRNDHAIRSPPFRRSHARRGA